MLGELYYPTGKALETAKAVLELDDVMACNVAMGCSHECTYCVSGNTLILMGDLSTKKIKNIHIGEEVIGIKKISNNKSHNMALVKTKVLKKFSVYKVPYTITLKNGTQLICSGEHRWLTERGWKYTFGTMQGKSQRPYLTINNHLRGVGRIEYSQKKETEDYMKGYLAGMIRGDGLLKKYKVKRNLRKSSPNEFVYMFRLALKDKDAIDRTKKYLYRFGIEASEFKFSMIDKQHNRVFHDSIRTAKKEYFLKINELIKLSNCSAEWGRGFLAGFFDAEGSSTCSTVQLSNKNKKLVDIFISYAQQFGFNFRVVLDERNDIYRLRLRGGNIQLIRFFSITNTAIKRKRVITHNKLKNIFTIVNIKKGQKSILMYDIKTTTESYIANGVVSHNCFGDTSNRRWFNEKGVRLPSKTPLELVQKQFAKGIKPQGVFLSFMTDPFIKENIENSFSLINFLASNMVRVSTLSKVGFDYRKCNNLMRCGTTIVSLDEEFRKKYEPNAPSIRERFKFLEDVKSNGGYTWVSLEPYPSPAIWEQDLTKLLNELQKVKVDFIIFGKWNYDDRAKDKEFYKKAVEQFNTFCNQHKIRHSVKSETLRFIGKDVKN